MKKLSYTKAAIAGSAFLFLGAHASLSQAAEGTLESMSTTSPIVLDAFAEAAWDNAKELKIKLNDTPYEPSNGYEGVKSTEVTIKSLHDRFYVYFMVSWDDPTKSEERFPWVKQTDGSWKQSSNKDSTGHENTYYEDKFGMYWNINAEGFEKKGCAVSCHLTEDGMNNGFKDTSAGRKYTKEGQTIDMWHWKGVRTNPLGLADDQFVDYPNRDYSLVDWSVGANVASNNAWNINSRNELLDIEGNARIQSTTIDVGAYESASAIAFVCEIEEVTSFIYKAPFDNGLTEHELDHILIGYYNESPLINADEVENFKWMLLEDVKKDMEENPAIYTEWFKIIFKNYYSFIKK